jgi:hypothetical protein
MRILACLSKRACVAPFAFLVLHPPFPFYLGIGRTTMATTQDVLDALRSTLATDGLEAIKFLDSSSGPTDDLSQAASIQIGNAGSYPRSEATRLMRSRNSAAASADSQSTPSTSPDDFFSLDAVVFALQMAGVQGGLYVVQATSRGLARFDAIERPDILAYLQGKRDDWDGVLSLTEVQRRKDSSRQGESYRYQSDLSLDHSQHTFC